MVSTISSRPDRVGAEPAVLSSFNTSSLCSYVLQISDHSVAASNQSQKKRGACKAVALQIMIQKEGDDSPQVFDVSAKCDARKSFSNASFAKHYQRSGVITVPLSDEFELIVQDDKINREGKFFLALLQSEESRKRPLLAFAADSQYVLSVRTHGLAGVVQCEIEATCSFEAGSASIVLQGQENVQMKGNKTNPNSKRGRGIKRSLEAIAKTEEMELNKKTLVQSDVVQPFNLPFSIEKEAETSSPNSPLSTSSSRSLSDHEDDFSEQVSMLPYFADTLPSLNLSRSSTELPWTYSDTNDLWNAPLFSSDSNLIAGHISFSSPVSAFPQKDFMPESFLLDDSFALSKSNFFETF